MTTFGPYPARVVLVHDGDTVDLDIDLGFGVFILAKNFDGKSQLSCRVYGINAPELQIGGVPNPPGQASLAFAQTLLKPGDKVTLLSHLWDKFGGRYDGEIKLADGRDFATVMVENNQAVVKKY